MNRPDKDLADFLSPLHPAFGRYAARQSRYELACQDALEKHLSQCLAGLLSGSARATSGLLLRSFPNSENKEDTHRCPARTSSPSFLEMESMWERD
ncbi:hypothetical protein SKAU_G00159000 [Synaphobranchus kaupii]|uniref:Uncharacterized protein n=1 Tax=Synaphobranchus kaupii TaxID=118154 RepID=A0A9Q1FIP9_SYNKA|nr:hypothetical protein SKAU_G00159000 [Synaphobranchus kaupii]